jgi:4-amino-4-deoxy-L-arabinose transferase-like glycosyltransferase
VLLALLLPQLGVAPLARAEIYFLDAARNMVETGDWLVPYYRASRSSTSRSCPTG